MSWDAGDERDERRGWVIGFGGHDWENEDVVDDEDEYDQPEEEDEEEEPDEP